MTSSIAALKPKKELLPHQAETVPFLLGNTKAYNFSACGSGKTLPTVKSIQLLFNHGCECRIVVVAPLSVIRATWLDHFEDEAPEVPILLMDSSASRKTRAARLVDFRGVVLINPDGVASVYHELVNWKPGHVIVDELAGYYRNRSTNRWKVLNLLVKLTHSSIWAFTGTPLTNNIMDFYAQCLLVNPDKLPKRRDGRVMGYNDLRDMLCNQPFPGVWVPKKGALEQVHSYMQPAIRFTREQVMSHLKQPILIRKQVPLAPEQKKALDEMIAKNKTVYGSQIISVKDTQALVSKLVQITTGTVYDSKGEPTMLPYGPRLQALMDLWEENECKPIIVAAPFIHTINRLQADLTASKHKVAVIYGDTPKAERHEIIKAFQAYEYDFLICHPKTLAHGVTLTASHVVCWFGPLYDLELYAQLNDRIFRFGQEDQPLIVELCSVEAEAKIYASLRAKERLAVKFLDLFGG